ncbi:MAG TPA: xylan 1,4-beta-xylosidase [Ruminococcus sp.]|nr:xylan 1,4-beta-xylosidase [Ruminococcus sp.]
MAKKGPSRFIEVFSQKTPGVTKVLVDTVTGVNYLFHFESEGYGAASGLTPLLNPDGSVVVTPPEMFLPPQ